jgi:hypothetical protein
MRMPTPFDKNPFQNSSGREWTVIGVDRSASGAPNSVELIARRHAESGSMQHAFRLAANEFRVFCAFAGRRPDEIVGTVSRKTLASFLGTPQELHAESEEMRAYWAGLVRIINARVERRLDPLPPLL